jgi:hypothetical protein
MRGAAMSDMDLAIDSATVPQPQMNRQQVKGRFYVGAAVFVILLNAAGFLPSLIDRSRRVAEPTWLVLTHGGLAGAWLLLFLIQATLVGTGRVAIHRRLGIAGAFIAFAMITIGSLTVIDMTRRGYDLSGDIARMAVPPGSPPLALEEFVAGMFPTLQAFANFGILTGFGLWFRHRPVVHKRLMLLALASLVVTPLIHLSGHLVGRWPDLYSPLNVAILIVANALLFAGAVHDKVSSGRVHPISLWVPVLLIVETFGLIAVVMPSDAWRRLAMWLVS